MTPSEIRSWLEENLRGEFSVPRVFRVLQERGVLPEEFQAALRDMARDKWRRARRTAILLGLGGLGILLAAILILAIRRAMRDEDAGFVRTPVAMVFLALIVIANGAWVWRRGRGFARVASGLDEPTKRSGRWILAVFGVILVLAGAALISIGTAGPEWLKSKLIDAAREQLGADLRIDSLTFSPWTGEGELRGIAFERREDPSEVRATVDALNVKVRVPALIRRSVEIERLDVHRPKIDWTQRVAGSSGPPRGPRRLPVADLRIHDGVVQFVSLREGGDPFRARASGVQYRAGKTSLDRFGDLLWGADLQANVDLGGSTSILKKQGSVTPSTLSLTRVDVAYADRYFDQADALVVAGGGADVRYTRGSDGKGRMEVDLKGLKLGENPSALKQEFGFVSIPRLREIVAARDGNLRAEFACDDRSDLRVLLEEVWTALWKDLFQKGKEKVLEGPAEKN